MGPQAQLTMHNAAIAHLTLTIAKLRRMQLKKAQLGSAHCCSFWRGDPVEISTRDASCVAVPLFISSSSANRHVIQ